MKVKLSRSAPAVTLIELMITVVILVIAALGALGYQYHAVRHVQIARAQMVATRITQMLLEDWKSTGGSPAYNPTVLGLGISGSGGIYYITQDNITMRVTLSSAEVVEGVTTLPLRQITVTVQWSKNFGGTIGDSDPSLQYTTYVRTDT